MKNKLKWYSILLFGLVLLLASSVIACQPAPVPPPPNLPKPIAVPWYEARDHISERTTVSGPIVDTHWASGSKGKPTFLNIGKPYPDPNRFTVVIWIDYRANFPQSPEKYYLGKTIFVTGLITEYKGIPQIEVKTPDQIEEQ